MRPTLALFVTGVLLLSACGGGAGETQLAGSATESSAPATPEEEPTLSDQPTVSDQPTGSEGPTDEASEAATGDAAPPEVATPTEEDSESVLDGAVGGPARGPSTELTGMFSGDDALEGGCAWVDAPDGRYEVTYPEGYTVEYGPVRLLGPDGEVVAEAGDTITVTGAPAEGMMSICQVGQLWTADSVQAG